MAKGKKTPVAEVERFGTKIVVPENIPLDKALRVLQEYLQQQEADVAINATIEASVYDGAYALARALQAKYGWVQLRPVEGFWGDEPPALISVPISATETIEVPWGRMSVPGVEGYLETSAALVQSGAGKRYVFRLGGQVKRKHELEVSELIAMTRRFVREESIYKGRAFRTRFRDAEGSAIPFVEPRFMDVTGVSEEELQFSREVDQAVKTNIFTPIEHTDACRAHGVPLKRGVLLCGPYGTGKTLTAFVTAKKAVKHGWTFIYCERADELADALVFARQYQPVIVFCEDLDRVLSGERSVAIDDILNVIDGIESKLNHEIMVILTTNHVDQIHQAMLRPGRLDAVIHVAPPDAETVIRLMRQYGGELIPASEDLWPAAEQMQGQIPAIIREAVERAKLAAIRADSARLTISGEALREAAATMKMQLDLLQPKEEDKRSERERAAAIIADALRTSTTNGVLAEAEIVR